MSLQKRYRVTLGYHCDECHRVTAVKVSKANDLRQMPRAWVELKMQWDIGVETLHYCSHSCLSLAVGKRLERGGYR